MKQKLNKINNKWVRLAVFIIVAINSAAMIFNVQLLPFDNDQIVAGASVVAMVLSEVWNHYQNNNYTSEAKRAQKYLDAEKETK
ncbi:SPP1 family holin [Virgibacillus natechei]|uniref:SPP1 family holin n=1 Tax=Virgibacillus natechei TaxID=1216297 RepID=A0ABS4IKV2_9BACI|nr:phage holin [Virgibacillus natechei]MBP1971566.1 SPP1 family holin [Virgibacillus natechei]UZD13100.1 SPP1 phage holin family protein [Virgibacillus natechei]